MFIIYNTRNYDKMYKIRVISIIEIYVYIILNVSQSFEGEKSPLVVKYFSKTMLFYSFCTIYKKTLDSEANYVTIQHDNQAVQGYKDF